MRKNLARVVQAVLIATILVVAWIMLRRPSYGCIGEKEARVVAGMRIDEYAAREKVPIPLFGQPETNPTHDGWAFHFRSDSRPRHLVTVIVHCDGGSELSRSVEH
jgi:hypothetical protein